MCVFVIAKDGTRLMPTHNAKKVRRLLKSGRAKIYSYEPFTIQLCYESEKNTQPVELKEDAGYQYIGISVTSEKHEYVSEERTLLKDEKQHHDDQRKLRRTRRNRKRYRKQRFSNRSNAKRKGRLAPSIQHKKDAHISIIKTYMKVCPITSVIIEVGQFDTQVLQAIQLGKPIPKGTDYQHGPKYRFDTLREAVFARDGYKCIVCGEEDGPKRLHHIGYWRGDHSNRMENLGTACKKCHIPKEHQKGGALWGLDYKRGFAGAAFMNTVKWQLYEEVKVLGVEAHITYGAVTKRNRKNRNLEKSHANDAYCMGKYQPKHRCRTVHYEKRRRNNRVLEKFYDAKYIDVRDGKTKKGAELGSNRPNRSVPRDNTQNDRKYHGKKVSKGKRTIRGQRYPMQPGDIVMYRKQKRTVIGTHSKGRCVRLTGGVDISPKKLKLLYHIRGWERA